ncbi:unnamed protein product [Rhizoctonia solani]|uniref:Uncharacterized protein n=1 Tax=Rhizoctonia solani TaxID=456999 RepID=A0A8H3D6Y9_9AGAM|nr:unnamed protein product [Rhizoctonia solani]
MENSILPSLLNLLVPLTVSLALQLASFAKTQGRKIDEERVHLASLQIHKLLFPFILYLAVIRAIRFAQPIIPEMRQ